MRRVCPTNSVQSSESIWTVKIKDKHKLFHKKLIMTVSHHFLYAGDKLLVKPPVFHRLCGRGLDPKLHPFVFFSIPRYMEITFTLPK